MACAPRPGDQLRELRNRLGVTTREVEELSRRLAERTGNEEYYISNAWLTQLENKDSVPSIYKLFSLSVIYRSTFCRSPGDLRNRFGKQRPISIGCSAGEYPSGRVRDASSSSRRNVSNTSGS